MVIAGYSQKLAAILKSTFRFCVHSSKCLSCTGVYKCDVIVVVLCLWVFICMGACYSNFMVHGIHKYLLLGGRVGGIGSAITG